MGGGLVAMQYVLGDGTVASQYPFNPNGSPEGIAGLTNTDGRCVHPSLCSLSWSLKDFGVRFPCMRLSRISGIFAILDMRRATSPCTLHFGSAGQGHHPDAAPRALRPELLQLLDT